MAESEKEYECQEKCNMEPQGLIAMDNSVDLKGRPTLRSKTGRWKACYFLIGYEILERMSFYGIASNLVIYLTTKLHEGTVNSSKNVNNWSGALWLTPVIGAYIADTHWGRYWTFTVFSCIYILGMVLLTLAVSLPSLRPPECKSEYKLCEKASKFQVGVFYSALYILAVGTGGTKPNISTMGADQFDDFDIKEKHQKFSFFNWWMFSAFTGTLIGQTFLIYIQEHVGFSLGYGIPTVGLIISVVIFLIGTPFYRHKAQKGNPFGRMAQVIVAAARKWRISAPSDPIQLHELDYKEYVAKRRFPIHHTRILRFLDKAATNDGSTSAWKLCPVTQVEETKLMIKLLPIWIAMLMPSAMTAQVNTLFVKQGTRLNRHLGSHFEIPPGCVTAFVTMSMLVFTVIYDRVLVGILRRFTGNPRGITILQRMGIGLAIHVLVMGVASITEIQRIRVVKVHRLQGNQKAVTPLTIFILLPQFLLMGIADSFVEVGKLEFFYDQAPESMQSIGTALFASTLGIGNFISSFLLTVMTNITGRKGHTEWILDNLNASRLYYYYALLAVLNVLNLIFFLAVSRSYVYKRETSEAFVGHSNGHVGTVTVESFALPVVIKDHTYEKEQQSTEITMVKSQGKSR
uniref:NPF family transporter n=1 Tax=Pinus pinaster TaxID=71647 RepID=A0A1S6YCQ7_PINPS|nr:NPF family transporter [Pinus pinaster]